MVWLIIMNNGCVLTRSRDRAYQDMDFLQRQTTKLVQGAKNLVKQSHCSIASVIFSTYWINLFSVFTMCCSRKYPYPSHGRFFKLNPPPSGNSLLVSYFHSKHLAFETPLPLGFPLTFHGVGMDIFWNYTISVHECRVCVCCVLCMYVDVYILKWNSTSV